MNAVVVTVSDRSAAGERVDVSGPLAAQLLAAHGFTTTLAVVADDRAAIGAVLRDAVAHGADLVVTTGGTGIGPRDVTPEATADVLDTVVPGISELLRRTAPTATAALSRAVAGITGRALIVNLAGSPGAVRDGLDVLLPLVGHALDQLTGGDH